MVDDIGNLRDLAEVTFGAGPLRGLKNEPHHRAGGLRIPGVGVAAGRRRPGPGMPGAVDLPMCGDASVAGVLGARLPRAAAPARGTRDTDGPEAGPRVQGLRDGRMPVPRMRRGAGKSVDDEGRGPGPLAGRASRHGTQWMDGA